MPNRQLRTTHFGLGNGDESVTSNWTEPQRKMRHDFSHKHSNG